MNTSDLTGGDRQGTRSATALGLILVAAFCLRLSVAIQQPHLWDETENAIPLAERISLSWSNPNLPIRGPHHPALPSYVIKASSTLFGTEPIGYRALHIVAGLISIALIWHLAALTYGPRAGLWSAALLAFNGYHVGVSSFATAKGPHLVFMVLSIYAFVRFQLAPRAVWLYASAVALGIAFYAKEHALLVLPAYALTLLQARYRSWWRSPHAYGALGLLLLILVPDIWWNLTTLSVDHAKYGDQFTRIGGVGFTVYPFLFFAHHGIRWVYEITTGEVLTDGVAENPSMNVLLGSLLFGLVVAATVRGENAGKLRLFLITLFWSVFLFFVSLRPGDPTMRLDPVAWYWTDVVLFPAVMLSGLKLAHASGRWGIALRILAIAGMLFAVARTGVWWAFDDEELGP